MVIYNTPTRLAGCGMCGADAGTTEVDVAPVLPPDSQEVAIATDPTQTVVAPVTAFDTQVASALKPLPSWAIGLGIGVVSLGVIAAVWAVSKRA